MTDAAYYRAEAERSRELAATAPDANTARRWNALADDYATLAEELDAHVHHRAPILRSAIRQPIQQQQQSKTNN